MWNIYRGQLALDTHLEPPSMGVGLNAPPVGPMQGAHNGTGQTHIHGPPGTWMLEDNPKTHNHTRGTALSPESSGHAYISQSTGISGAAHALDSGMEHSAGMVATSRVPCSMGGPYASCLGYIDSEPRRKVADVQRHLNRFHVHPAGSLSVGMRQPYPLYGHPQGSLSVSEAYRHCSFEIIYETLRPLRRGFPEKG